MRVALPRLFIKGGECVWLVVSVCCSWPKKKACACCVAACCSWPRRRACACCVAEVVHQGRRVRGGPEPRGRRLDKALRKRVAVVLMQLEEALS